MSFISVNGTNLFYQIDGPDGGTPILLSNSLASNLSMWDLQIESLTTNGFKVIRYDSRGHGRSDAPVGPYSIELLADDAAALIEAAALGPAHFCGLSKGGMVGQMMGIRHSEKVKTLTIADSAAFMPGKEMWEQRISTVEKGGMVAVVQGTIERWITLDGRTRLPDEVERIRAMILDTPVNGFIGCCQAIMAMDMRPTNGSIAQPTLVICGEQDTGTTPAQAKEIADAIPNSVLELIPNAAHLANIEQSELFNAALMHHLLSHR